MRKTGLLAVGLALVTCVLVPACVPALLSEAAQTARGPDAELDISPETLLLSSYQGGEVAAHTDIPYGDVVLSSVALEGFAALRTKADATGNFVGFFSEEAIKGLVPAGAVELQLELTGSLVSGADFAITDSVQVMP
jgi:hypothetical protein